MKDKSLKKYFYLLGGILSLVLGAAGIVLPILPTTPFLLLSAFCFLHSSPGLHNWVMHHRFFGPYIYCYVNYRAIERGVKIKTILGLWLTLVFSILLVPLWQVKVGLIVVGLGVSWHVGRLKNLSARELRDYRSHFKNGSKWDSQEL